MKLIAKWANRTMPDPGGSIGDDPSRVFHFDLGRPAIECSVPLLALEELRYRVTLHWRDETRPGFSDASESLHPQRCLSARLGMRSDFGGLWCFAISASGSSLRSGPSTTRCAWVRFDSKNSFGGRLRE